MFSFSLFYHVLFHALEYLHDSTRCLAVIAGNWIPAKLFKYLVPSCRLTNKHGLNQDVYLSETHRKSFLGPIFSQILIGWKNLSVNPSIILYHARLSHQVQTETQSILRSGKFVLVLRQGRKDSLNFSPIRILHQLPDKTVHMYFAIRSLSLFFKILFVVISLGTWWRIRLGRKAELSFLSWRGTLRAHVRGK